MICYSGYIMMQILEESASSVFMLTITSIINFSEGNKTHKDGILQYNLTLYILKIIFLDDLSLGVSCTYYYCTTPHILVLSFLLRIHTSIPTIAESYMMEQGVITCHWNMKRTFV